MNTCDNDAFLYRCTIMMTLSIVRKSREYSRMCSQLVGRSRVFASSGNSWLMEVLARHEVPGASVDSQRYSMVRSYHKETTGIVGLPMNEKAREDLKDRIGSILESLESHGIPSTAAYRQTVEERCREKMKALMVHENTDEELEKLFGRQLEQEIKLCDDELSLIPKMAEWKPWEAVEGKTINVVEDLGQEEDEADKS